LILKEKIFSKSVDFLLLLLDKSTTRFDSPKKMLILVLGTISMLAAINPLPDRSSSPDCDYSYKYVRRRLGGFVKIYQTGWGKDNIKMTKSVLNYDFKN
jgi:hypothetical protein